MKKIVLTLLLCFPYMAAMYAQCTPDPTLTDLITEPAGSRHDTLYTATDTTEYVVLPHGRVGQNYHEVLYIKVPIDTVAFGQPATINFVRLDSIINLPPGLSINCNPNNCTFPGGSAGCLSMDGVPQVADSIEMQIAVTVNITAFGLPTPFRDTIGGFYFVTKGSPVGLDEEATAPASPTVYPNPAADQVNFVYSAASSGKAILTITNMVGRVVVEQPLILNGGKNTVNIPVDHLKPGIYLYSFREEGKTFTGRFSIAR